MSLYAAASEAVKGFESLPEDVPKTFIFIGNKQSHGFVVPSMISLGMGKAAAAYLMGSSAAEYSKRGFKYAQNLLFRLQEADHSGAASTMSMSERTTVKPYLGPSMATLTESTSYD